MIQDEVIEQGGEVSMLKDGEKQKEKNIYRCGSEWWLSDAENVPDFLTTFQRNKSELHNHVFSSGCAI